MLVLSRKQNETILIGDGIKLTVVKIRGNTVQIGIEAPREVSIIRGELRPDLKAEKNQQEIKIQQLIEEYQENLKRIKIAEERAIQELRTSTESYRRFSPDLLNVKNEMAEGEANYVVDGVLRRLREKKNH